MSHVSVKFASFGLRLPTYAGEARAGAPLAVMPGAVATVRREQCP
ncbi:hypothetical protein AKJ09_09270 [Labilithrix luteola]|uniref:Uncharacterized protein n=1 Tax=Labilithrix luteola TaxID=1391654 RepID=A0A0K1QAA4_9BACT|nr:hypothetical protein [Labilithrix luteola]AKV02607.1 hypothetical protein AKJ09_09270 [Labilithrix luteola]